LNRKEMLGLRERRHVLIPLLVAGYVFFACGLSGIPGVARLAAVFAACLWLALVLSKNSILTPRWLLLPGCTLAWLTVAAIRLEAPPWSMLAIFLVALGGAVAVSSALYNHKVRLDTIYWAAVAAALLNIAAPFFGVKEALVSDMGLMGGRSSLLVGNANALAIRMALPAIIAVLGGRRFGAWAQTVALGLSVAGVGISGSRKGLILLGIVAIPLVFGITLSSRTRLRRFVVGTAVAMLAVLIFVVANRLNAGFYDITAADRLVEAVEGKEAAFNARVNMIKTGWRLFLERPVFGYGLDQFALLSGFGTYSHNNYIELLISGGVIALALYYSTYMYIISRIWRRKWRNGWRQLLILALLAGLLDPAMVSFYDKAVMLTLMMLLWDVTRNDDVKVAAKRVGWRASGEAPRWWLGGRRIQ
jgi:O-antigen ligase